GAGLPSPGFQPGAHTDCPWTSIFKARAVALGRRFVIPIEGRQMGMLPFDLPSGKQFFHDPFFLDTFD
ncbi:MAG: hypothetical protein K6A65_09245, partial [Succinivibrionaceae bacterium]|nr:hypothetical protein [Succinivibrionaceae bacterium]